MSEVHTEAALSGSFNTLLEESSEKLTWVTPTAPMSYHFVWEEIPFSAKLSKTGNGHRLIHLGYLGSLPFSAEHPQLRERLRGLLAWKDEKDHIRFVLEPKRQQIFLMIDDILEGELTGTRLIASSVKTLLNARPYMELAREVGWQRPSSPIPHKEAVLPDDQIG
ncbi:hypothetical protein [Sneathiella chinensis]|uniref:Uncharacterized protein n=1 Tax=Sneathiella chinensis TaxID=349750 RepID=A0ABQ5U6P9_9PROT|nr:hypothetical protein [Sneathiella chinensis]GLQ07071.1 hypothetical protein GCM10007924_22920 [Sneathiella chinensis]